MTHTKSFLVALTFTLFLRLVFGVPLISISSSVFPRSNNVGNNNEGSDNIGNNNVGNNNRGSNNVGDNNVGNNNTDSSEDSSNDNDDDDDDDVCSDTKDIKTFIRFTNSKLQWGEATPSDVVGYLDSPDHQGPCVPPPGASPDSFTSCSNDAWHTMPTTLTGGLGYRDTHLNITVDKSTTFGPGTFKAYKAALREALHEYNNQTMVEWRSTQKSCSSTSGGMGCFGSGALDQLGVPPDGTMAQNLNTKGITIDRYNGQTPCGHFRIDFAVEGQNPENENEKACRGALLGLTGISAAMSILLPPMAIVAGFFGAMQTTCENFE